MIGRISLLLLLATAGVAHAEPPPDLAPIKCTWASFTPEQQKRLRDAFIIDNSAHTHQHNRPSDEETYAAAQICKLAYTMPQIAELAGALGWRAREDVSRMGVAARGLVKPALIDRALGNLDDDRRIEIGDRLACPNGYTMERGWDGSVIRAIRRTGTKTMDGPSVTLLGFGVYAILAQEGHMRRIGGASPSCPPRS